MRVVLFVLVLLGAGGAWAGAPQIELGQLDTFDAGLDNWGSGAPNPVPPEHVAADGPEGAEDGYLRARSNGGAGAG